MGSKAAEPTDRLTVDGLSKGLDNGADYGTGERTDAKGQEILRENVGIQFLPLRHEFP